MVEPGDECYLEAGDYEHDGLTTVHGTADKRITITGDEEACIKGTLSYTRALHIAHDYYTVQGICFDGDHGGGKFANKAIYVLGGDKKTEKDGVLSSVTGLRLLDLNIKVRKNVTRLTAFASRLAFRIETSHSSSTHHFSHLWCPSTGGSACVHLEYLCICARRI